MSQAFHMQQPEKLQELWRWKTAQGTNNMDTYHYSKQTALEPTDTVQFVLFRMYWQKAVNNRSAFLPVIIVQKRVNNQIFTSLSGKST